ncbi:hypothetical protein [Bradyrhizobium sp. HKCCYLR1023]|uniref:hypothetical protein n=1 Tax=Bradyrhizobium TaxID=374 RepID=UPI003EB8C23D
MDIAAAATALQKFTGASLTVELSRIESSLKGASKAASLASLSGDEKQALAAAASLKRIAAQVNTTIHALGIMLCLPHLLEDGEIVEYVSLGAGNTGRAFDLETNLRVAEFKFIQWQGTAETIRQNSIFKDYFLLEDYQASKRKYLYVLGTAHPLKFFHAKRAIASVLSKDEAVRDQFRNRFGDRYTTVREYFADHGGAVLIEDVSRWVPELIFAETAEAESDCVSV